MIPKTSLLLICVIFIAWGFNKFVGIFGLTTVLTFYWLQYLKLRRVFRKKVKKHKEGIIAYFDNFNGKQGEEHFDYLYSNAQNILDITSTLTITFINNIVKAVLIFMSFYFMWNSDWISLSACIIIGVSTALFSSKYLQYYKYLIRSIKSEEGASDEMLATLTRYADFLDMKIYNKCLRNCPPSNDECSNQ